MLKTDKQLLRKVDLQFKPTLQSWFNPVGSDAPNNYLWETLLAVRADFSEQVTKAKRLFRKWTLSVPNQFLYLIFE